MTFIDTLNKNGYSPMIKTNATIRVRFSETDAMGVVYHANYFPWLEVARTQLLAEAGLPYRELQNSGYLLPVLELGFKYNMPAKYDDEICVRAIMKEFPRVKIRIDYEVFRGNEILATGFSVHAFMNRDGKAIKPPEFFIEKLRLKFEASS